MNFILIFCKQMVSVLTSDIQLMKEWRWLLPQESIKEATKAVLKDYYGEHLANFLVFSDRVL